MKLSSFKDLRVIKKSLEPDAESASGSSSAAGVSGSGGVQKRRSHVVTHRSKEEERARGEGIVRGQRVRIMDSNDTGTIVGFGADYYEVDIDGMTVRMRKGDFYLIDAEEDMKLRESIPARKAHARKEASSPKEAANGDLRIDLHLERIPGNEGVPDWAALEFQMNYFRQILRQNLRHRGRRIMFIHGVGDGTLASAIRKELDETFALTCSYTVGTPGVTTVTIR